MVKSNEKFEKVKQLKAQGKTGTEITKEIDISKEMVYIIFSAIKHNCHSIPEYHDYIIKRIINPETGRNFLDVREYHNYTARRNGFENESSYVQFRKFERSQEELSEQEKFERSVKLFSPEKLDKKILDDRSFELEIESKDNIELLLNRIPDRYRKVLEMRYIDGRSQEETGHLLSITYQAIQQIEKRAREYFHSGNKIRNHNKIEDGELLLVHILSKSLEIEEKSKLAKIADLDNEIYHHKNVRTKKQIEFIIYDKRYKDRLKKLNGRYFPLS